MTETHHIASSVQHRLDDPTITLDTPLSAVSGVGNHAVCEFATAREDGQSLPGLFGETAIETVGDLLRSRVGLDTPAVDGRWRRAAALDLLEAPVEPAALGLPDDEHLPLVRFTTALGSSYALDGGQTDCSPEAITEWDFRAREGHWVWRTDADAVDSTLSGYESVESVFDVLRADGDWTVILSTAPTTTALQRDPDRYRQVGVTPYAVAVASSLFGVNYTTRPDLVRFRTGAHADTSVRLGENELAPSVVFHSPDGRFGFCCGHTSTGDSWLSGVLESGKEESPA
ncbi:hypothetical protein [Haloarchaeobius sp. DFWS5]|uniref:hypothetical protein n=1 Tax=Haloarchaeobius sp. DFWS5 TaxID=3446114 RepID=UPI003EB84546